MHRTDVARLFDTTGPFVSVYLDTAGDVEQAAGRVALRWKNLRGELLGAGVPCQTVTAIDPLVEGSQAAGGTLAVVAGADGVLYEGSFPDPPPRDAVVRQGPLPYVLPLLAWRQRLVPYVAVLTDRTGADIAARMAGGPERAEHVEGRTPPHIHKPNAGGWSQPRYQRRSELLWESNAGEVADALTGIVDQTRPRFVAAAGDVRALQLLREHAPKRVVELLEVVGGEYPSMAAVDERAAKLVAAAVERDTATVLARFAGERGQGGRAAEGAAATLQALARGQVETLLVTDDPDDRRTAWFGEAPSQAGLDAEAVRAMGEGTPVQAGLADVAVRAALGTGASVRVLDRGLPDAPSEGLGAVLRFAG